MRVVNVPMRRVLNLPFATPVGRHLMLLHLTGRRTGRTYHQPVSYTRHGDVLLTPGGGRWTLNLIEDRPAPIRLLGRDITARPELISDPHEVEPLLDVMVRANRPFSASSVYRATKTAAWTGPRSQRRSRMASGSCAGTSTQPIHHPRHRARRAGNRRG
jgi:hypothetical protein